MSNENDELFEGKVELLRSERGDSFGILHSTYFRMANMSMDASSMGIEPTTIRKLAGFNERGCRLDLYGPTHGFSVTVRARYGGTNIIVTAQPLDAPADVISLYEAEDSDRTWSKVLRLICAVEKINYVDRFWAEEQQQGDGGEATAQEDGLHDPHAERSQAASWLPARA